MKLSFTSISFFAIALLITISSCNKGPTGGIPFYMQMDTAQVSTFRGITTGENTQGIKDVWVTAGVNNLGAYEMPCNFPVLLKDSVAFVVSPGIWQSGQSQNPVIYPLMNPDVFTLAATPTNVYTHIPKFTYKAGDTVLFNEDFETDLDYNSGMTYGSDNVKYGHKCGKITVSPSDSSVMACQQNYHSPISGGHATPYVLTPGKEIWIELDYKTDVPFWSGVIAHFASGSTDTIPILFLLPNTNWTKEYIKLSETVGQEGAYSYSLYFQGLNISGTAGGSVYLDNIRLIYL